MSLIVNGRLIRPGMSLAEVQLERLIQQEKDNESRERFEQQICQCCGYEHTDPRCACDTHWFLDEQGNAECFIHRMKRAGDRRNG